MPTTLPAMIARFVEDEVVDCGALSREVNTAWEVVGVPLIVLTISLVKTISEGLVLVLVPLLEEDGEDEGDVVVDDGDEDGDD